ncbi:hypothetical protein Cma02nite_21810 [Cellulomonas marina]|nr:hypothetical protein Cma02nite_21810 [Cellulomonas marina]
MAAAAVALVCLCLLRWRVGAGPAGLALDAGAAVVAVLAALVASRRAGGPRSRSAWQANAVASAAWLLVPVVAAAGWPAALAAVGAVAFPVGHAAAWWLASHASSTLTRVRLAVDGVVGAASVFVVAWAAVLGGVWPTPDHGIPGLPALLGAAFGTVAAASMCAGVALSEMPPDRRLMPALTAAGILLVGAAGVAGLVGAPALGAAPGFALLALATVVYDGTSTRHTVSTTRSTVLYTPYVLIGPAAVTLAVQEWRGTVPLPEAVTAGVVVVLVLLRQSLTLAENRALVRRLAATEARLREQAWHDALTGLANRERLRERLAAALEAHGTDGRALAVVFLDLDDFKDVNDSLGHAAGDEVLVDVAGRLRAVLAPHRGDATPVRLGGDEFAVLLLGSAARDAVRTAQRVRESLAAPFCVGGRRLALGASVGVALLTGDEATPTTTELLRAADVAMYAVKQHGKNGVEVFSPALRQSTSADLELRAALVVALDEGQVELAYQPIVRVADGALMAFEALARWDRPGVGPVPPTVFVPAAEAAGLSRRLTDAVLERACADLAGWVAAGPVPERIRVGVNVAASELADEGLAGRVEAALRRHGLRGDRLAVEVTETALAQDEGPAAREVGRLGALGCRIAVDDFGTGYSSLSRLGALPVDTVKIDMLFVRAAVTPQGREVLDAVVALARAFGLVTIAEGVETEAELAAVRASGCDLAQGYGIGRPTIAAHAGGLVRLALRRDLVSTVSPRP